MRKKLCTSFRSISTTSVRRGSSFYDSLYCINDNNLLDLNRYIIPKDLHEALYVYGNYCQPLNISKDSKGIYLVSFRRLNLDNNVLIYNYIYFDMSFCASLLVYFILRDYYIKNIGFKD
jgi:hypothetical protein